MTCCFDKLSSKLGGKLQGLVVFDNFSSKLGGSQFIFFYYYFHVSGHLELFERLFLVKQNDGIFRQILNIVLMLRENSGIHNKSMYV